MRSWIAGQCDGFRWVGWLALTVLSACATPAAPERPADADVVVAGRVTDAEGRPLAGVHITLYDGVATRAPVDDVLSDQDGVYRFEGIPRVSVPRYDHPAAGQWWVGVGLFHPEWAAADGRNFWDLTIEPFTPEVTRDFVLAPAGELTGVVEANDAVARPLAVRVYQRDRHVRFVPCDDGGAFSLAGLAPGTYAIDLEDSDLRFPRLGEATVAAGEVTRVELQLP